MLRSILLAVLGLQASAFLVGSQPVLHRAPAIPAPAKRLGFEGRVPMGSELLFTSDGRLICCSRGWFHVWSIDDGSTTLSNFPNPDELQPRGWSCGGGLQSGLSWSQTVVKAWDPLKGSIVWSGNSTFGQELERQVLPLNSAPSMAPSDSESTLLPFAVRGNSAFDQVWIEDHSGRMLPWTLPPQGRAYLDGRPLNWFQFYKLPPLTRMGYGAHTLDVSLSADGFVAVTLSMDAYFASGGSGSVKAERRQRWLRIWHRGSEAPIKEIDLGETAPGRVCLSPEGNLVFCATQSQGRGVVRVFDGLNGSDLGSFEPGMWPIQWYRGGSRFLTTRTEECQDQSGHRAPILVLDTYEARSLRKLASINLLPESHTVQADDPEGEPTQYVQMVEARNPVISEEGRWLAAWIGDEVILYDLSRTRRSR